jgi:signal transduction histidine kinase
MIVPILHLLKPDIEKDDIEVHLSVNPDHLTVNADKEQIEQVLINLIKNAIQALDENTEHHKNKEIHIEAALDTDENIVIRISDNGTGIDEDALKKVFIPFFTTKKSGSGIGLSLSKQIMRKHNGNISVKSIVNIGTECTMKFIQ